MVRDYIYYMPVVISIIGLFSIIYVLINKNYENNRFMIKFNIFNLIYLFLLCLFHNFFPIIIGLEILLVWVISIVGVIFYIVSLVICLIKRKKLKIKSDGVNVVKFLKILVLIPLFLLIVFFGRELYLIYNSQIIVSYSSSGNGTFGDTHDFNYAINDKYVEEISIDVDEVYFYNNKLLKYKFKEMSENEMKEKKLKIEVNDNNELVIFMDNKKICNKKINSIYYNVELNHVYYNKR